LQVYNLNDEKLKELMVKVQTEGLSIHHEQNFTESQFVEFFKRIGECEAPGLFMNPKDHPELFLVTGKRDAEGKKIGMFGDGELGWHSNGNSRHLIDKILISLYCIKGDVNTTLSICNTSDPFYDLSEDEQDYWKSINIRLQFQNDTMYHLDEDDPELEFMSKNKGSIRSLVGKHPHTGKYYFYFPYHFIIKAWEGKTQIDHTQMIERLKPIIFKSKYQKHHVFLEGDLLLMDQFTTLHRRTPVMGDRLLWRVACDYSKLV
jgi:alpha-ketoglutarate-dependent taurine dioxygenase